MLNQGRKWCINRMVLIFRDERDHFFPARWDFQTYVCLNSSLFKKRNPSRGDFFKDFFENEVQLLAVWKKKKFPVLLTWEDFSKIRSCRDGGLDYFRCWTTKLMKHTVSTSLNFSLLQLISEGCKKQRGITCLKVTWRSVGAPWGLLCFHRGFLALDKSLTAGRLLCTDLPVTATPSGLQSSVCLVSRCEWGDWGGVHHGTALHQQDEVRGEVPGQPQQAAGERPDRLQQEDERQREGACSLPAPHFTGTFLPSLSHCSKVWWGLLPCEMCVLGVRNETWGSGVVFLLPILLFFLSSPIPPPQCFSAHSVARSGPAVDLRMCSMT